MAGIEKLLAVDWLKQEKLYYCGPAAVQMFLKYFGVAVTQDILWADIKANSNGAGSSNPPSAAMDPDFPTQVCENCDDARPPVWTCWNSTPDALRQTAAGHTAKATLAIRYPSTFEQGVTELIESIDRSPGVPPFATLTSMNHWVIVAGYLQNDMSSGEFPAKPVGTYMLNGLYVLDPEGESATDAFKLMTVAAWQEQFGLIACASDPNLDRYPVVVGTDVLPKWVMFILVALFVVLLYWLWYVVL